MANSLDVKISRRARARLLRALLVLGVASWAVGLPAVQSVAQGVVDRGSVGDHADVLSQADQRAPEDPAILSSIDPVATQTLRLEIGDRVFFAAGSAAIGARARTVLTRQAQWLMSSTARIAIVGHADDSRAVEGAEAADLEISLRRAEAVRDRLIEYGVSADRITVVPMGRSKPIAPCDDAMCGVQNRRAITVVLGAARTQPE